MAHDPKTFGKKCANCGTKFARLGGSAGLLGILVCFLLFGGTSKYCSSCREALKAKGEKVDKSPLFRLIWLAVAILILYAILTNA